MLHCSCKWYLTVIVKPAKLFSRVLSYNLKFLLSNLHNTFQLTHNILVEASKCKLRPKNSVQFQLGLASVQIIDIDRNQEMESRLHI